MVGMGKDARLGGVGADVDDGLGMVLMMFGSGVMGLG